jgi:Domain of unknown function (DUF4411)
MWDKIGSMLEAGKILIPDEVEKEIGSGNDPLIDWLKKHNVNKVPISQEQIEIVTEIVNKYPLVSQYKKPRPYHADPDVVAVAKINGCTVVTFEVRNGSKTHPSVPDLCKEYGVKCCTMADLFEREGWRFEVK